MKKRIKKNVKKSLENESASLEEIPSISTSLKNVTESIGSVAVNAAKETSGAEISEVSVNVTSDAGVVENNKDFKDAKASVKITRLIENQVKHNAAVIGEKLYSLSVSYDNASETIRMNITDMLTSAMRISDLIANRIYRASLYMIGRRKHEETGVSVKKALDDKMQALTEDIREGQLGELLADFKEVRKSGTKLFDKIAVGYKEFLKKIESVMDSVINAFKANKKRHTAGLATVVCCIMMFSAAVNACTVYNYSYHGTELGAVKDKTQIETAVQQVSENVSADMNVDVDVKAEPEVDITYEKQFSIKAAVDSSDAVANKLMDLGDLEGDGFAIQVNGRTVALVDTRETADKILKTIKENYCTIDPEETEEALEVSAEQAINPEETRNLILADSANNGTGIVASGEFEGSEAAVPAMAGEYSGIDFWAGDPEELTGISIDNVEFQEEITIEPVTAKVSSFKDFDSAIDLFVDKNGASKLITVETTELDVYDVEVPFGTVTEETEELYEGETQVLSEGILGVNKVVAKVVCDNGEEVERTVLDQDVVSIPVDEVILVGTKEKPSWTPTGSFINPANGRLSSRYGARWGRLHAGIDIAGSMGSDILAADGGTVVYSGYNANGYGNLVKIDHGNGTQTWYAHNSELLVSAGDKVYQGQPIAKLGNTGRSTGPHCHFEVRINGSAVDPLSYVNY
ncbi:MAG: peptidoglycan DD-metalloendopeptidase family protein [Firmicutes bacterium]|nr:peptidoglycan DD-metalloendopeptidase family protein [Bacillota bacterium]